jgi:nicotinate-nucleotide adenylyltransferase
VDFLRLAMPRVEISSSDIRLRVNEGRPIDFLTPAPVVELIRIHHLYRPIGYPGSQNGS